MGNLKCICINKHRKYLVGEIYDFELKDSTKLPYSVSYGMGKRRHFGKSRFDKTFEELSVYRNRLIDKILE